MEPVIGQGTGGGPAKNRLGVGASVAYIIKRARSNEMGLLSWLLSPPIPHLPHFDFALEARLAFTYDLFCLTPSLLSPLPLFSLSFLSFLTLSFLSFPLLSLSCFFLFSLPRVLTLVEILYDKRQSLFTLKRFSFIQGWTCAYDWNLKQTALRFYPRETDSSQKIKKKKKKRHS